MDQSQIDLKQDFEELNWLAQSFGINHYTKNVNLTVQNKHYLKQKLRSHIALVAARRVGERWQSPSYNHTVLSQAGDQVNKIKGNITDYTRDQLIDGNTLQKQFSRVFLDTWRGLPVIPYFTSSGMAALTTILVFLLREKKINRPVLLGTNSYFQNAEVITRVLPVQVIKVEEPDLPSQISKTNPSAVFVDSLSNTHNLVRADLVQIIKSLKNFKTEITQS